LSWRAENPVMNCLSPIWIDYSCCFPLGW
jgi:hypothetical protein